MIFSKKTLQDDFQDDIVIMKFGILSLCESFNHCIVYAYRVRNFIKINMAMEGFDDPGVFFSDNFSDAQGDSNTNLANKKQFLKFIKEFQEGNFAYKYRDALKRNYLR